MTIKSTVPTPNGLKVAVYTASVMNKGTYTDNIYTLLIDETKGKFHNIASNCIIEMKFHGNARYKSRMHAHFIAQAERLAQEWAACA
ncbi:MAG: hypothetical protein WCJ64_20235 [Rhodospirillaceae bacterium]